MTPSVRMSVMYVGQPRADLDAALASPERKASADDVKRFPEFRGQIERQILDVRPYFP